MGLFVQLIKQGWKMDDIDRCDLMGYMQVLAFSTKEQGKVEGTIDEVPFLQCGNH